MSTCKPRPISGNLPLDAIAKDYNRYCDRIVGNAGPLLEKLGPELVVNGFGDNLSGGTDSAIAPLFGWTNGGTHNASNHFTIDGSSITFAHDGTFLSVTNDTTIVPGKAYRYCIDVIATTGTIMALTSLDAGPTDIQIGGSGVGKYEGDVLAGTTIIQIKRVNAGSITFTYSLKEIL